jgi:hypothetical protein
MGDQKMRGLKLAAFLGGVLMLVSPVAWAGSAAPKELYGKSITVGWSETETGSVADQPMPRTWGRAISMNIYISTAGRAFLRRFGGTTGGFNPHGITNNYGQRTTEAAPGESNKDRFDFQGRSIILYSLFKRGARRISIDFDASATSCKASIITGKEGGKSILRTRAEISSVEIGTVNCSIREGNVFGQ